MEVCDKGRGTATWKGKGKVRGVGVVRLDRPRMVAAALVHVTEPDVTDLG